MPKHPVKKEPAMSDQSPETPVNPLPPAVTFVFIVLAGIELALFLGSKGIIGGPEAIGWRIGWMEQMGFAPRIFGWMLDTGQYPPEHLMRFVTYPFVHASFTHGLFAMVIMLAMGKIVAEAMGQLAFLVIFFASAAFGALVFALVQDRAFILIGAYPSAYGLIGGFTYLLWLKLGAVGAQQFRAFQLIGFLLAIQLLFAMIFGGDPDWIADLAGFVCGLVISVILVPGGAKRLLDRIRRG